MTKECSKLAKAAERKIEVAWYRNQGVGKQNSCKRLLLLLSTCRTWDANIYIPDVDPMQVLVDHPADSVVPRTGHVQPVTHGKGALSAMPKIGQSFSSSRAVGEKI